MKGRLFILTGPSGVGKDAVLNHAQTKGLDIARVKTCATRSMRPRESQGNPYHFIEKLTFERMIENGEMLEWNEVYGNLYGSRKQDVNQALETFQNVFMVLEPVGARAMKRFFPSAHTIFITPPSLDILFQRINERGGDNKESIQKRIDASRIELSSLTDWDCVIENKQGKLDETAEQLISFVQQFQE